MNVEPFGSNKALNVPVWVTHWFRGINLGPERFKIIKRFVEQNDCQKE